MAPAKKCTTKLTGQWTPCEDEAMRTLRDCKQVLSQTQWKSLRRIAASDARVNCWKCRSSIRVSHSSTYNVTMSATHRAVERHPPPRSCTDRAPLLPPDRISSAMSTYLLRYYRPIRSDLFISLSITFTREWREIVPVRFGNRDDFVQSSWHSEPEWVYSAESLDVRVHCTDDAGRKRTLTPNDLSQQVCYVRRKWLKIFFTHQQTT